jgi:hypothetical protein
MDAYYSNHAWGRYYMYGSPKIILKINLILSTCVYNIPVHVAYTKIL